MNLLTETLEEIVKYGETEDNVLFVGSLDSKYQISFNYFKRIADIEYYNGHGRVYVCTDLCIRFKNNSILLRQEYDGFEYWSYIPAIQLVHYPKEFNHVCSDQGWTTIDDINNGT